MKFILTACLFLFTSMVIKAQIDFCGAVSTPDPNYDLKEFENFKQQFKLTKNASYEIPIQIHIIRGDEGITNINIADIRQALTLANSYFTGHDIQFVACNDVRFIDNSEYLKFSRTKDKANVAICNIPNVLNVYFTNQVFADNGEVICGFGNFPWLDERIIVVSYSCLSDGALLAHEFGHTLGLFHTHEVYAGKEYVDGTNCQITGDMLCDTPADPGLNVANVDQFCVYIGEEKDPIGQAYTPNSRFLMSYSPSQCRRRFSTEQGLRMHFYIEEYFQNYVCPEIPSTPKDLVIYPNPTTDFVKIYNQKCSDFTVVLFDTRGKKVLEQKNKNLIDVNRLKEGLYIIYLQDNLSEQSFTRSVVVF